MFKSNLVRSLAFFLLVCLLAFLLFNHLIPVAKPRLRQADVHLAMKPTLNYVALGDSLTEGVGDSTKQGGFVPLLAQAITHQHGYQVTVKNFGIGGNTSGQILKRLKKDRELQASLAEADVMTLTVGGNNIMGVLRKEIANLKLSSFEKAAKTYQKDLKEMIRLARQDNPDLPIYVVGVYNPYYLNFPELEAMQGVIDDWNKGTRKTIKSFKQVYFVPINDLIYKGIDGGGVTDKQGEKAGMVTNDALYEQDSFHPNNIGYQIMQGAIMEKMNETSHVWKKD